MERIKSPVRIEERDNCVRASKYTCHRADEVRGIGMGCLCAGHGISPNMIPFLTSLYNTLNSLETPSKGDMEPKRLL